MDVGAWLRRLGLERYEPAFRDHEIDWQVLPELTEADLEKLGIPLGPRKKLLKAIALLAAASAPEAPRGAARVATTIPPHAAERRQLTVMFVDLVGSTELAARLDPEELGELLRNYQTAVATEITRFEGHIAKFMGDGVLAYFGWPRAHEDEAERAVRAGLALGGRIARLSAADGTPLAARVGIATGLVVVGELIGEGSAQEQTVVGETPNLAARLQALAAPGAVVIAPSTRRLIAGAFALEDQGAHHLKGFAAPLQVWRVVCEAATSDRFAAHRAERLSPLVGREEELALLLRCWQRAAEGAGQVVLLAGEPGIGKSRLVEGLRMRLAGQPHARLGYQGSPHHVNSALHPVIDQLRRAAGMRRDDAAATKLDKLEALLAGTPNESNGAAALLAALLSLPTARYPPLSLTPQQHKARTLAALFGQLEALAAHQPVLLVVEDAHWLDPSTLEWLELVVERAPRLPLLAVITFRPGFTPSWHGYPHVTLLTLDRLGRDEVETLIAQVAGGGAIPAELAAQIVARADGVPLFIEELTKTVLEAGTLRQQAGHLDALQPPLAIPATLQDSLMARLDRLAPVKAVAQIAAALGREFSYDLLAAVAPLDGGALRAALRQLIDAELIFGEGVPPQASYSFRHALVQEAAYQSLLKSRRRDIHARIARALEGSFPALAEAEPEVLAHHCAEAALVEQAVGYRERAGRRAAERFAHKEAIAHFAKALELLQGLPETPERDRVEIRLQTALGTWLMAARGPVPELRQAYARARALCERWADKRQLYTAVWGLWYFHAGRMELNTARNLSYELLALAEHQQDTGPLLQAHHAAWTVLQFQGELPRCWEHLEHGLKLYDPDEHGGHAHLYGGHDPGVCCRSRGALTLWLLGYPDRAAVMSQEAVRLAEQLAQPFSLAIALGQGAYVHQLRGDAARVDEQAEATIAVAVEQGFPMYLAVGPMLRGWAAAARGQLDEGIAMIHQGLEGLPARSSFNRSYYLALLAEVCGRAGRHEDGLRALAEAMAFVEEKGERWWEAELHRLEGELLLGRSGEASAAEGCFQRALEVARRQGARAFELRAATGLARLWADRGRRSEAHDGLARIYAGFTEGFETADLVDARALLGELA